MINQARCRRRHLSFESLSPDVEVFSYHKKRKSETNKSIMNEVNLMDTLAERMREKIDFESIAFIFPS